MIRREEKNFNIPNIDGSFSQFRIFESGFF